MYDVLIIGGGAAGFFTAINCKEKNKNLKVAILERGKEFLTKVKVSGGGRCNVTNSIFDTKELFYDSAIKMHVNKGFLMIKYLLLVLLLGNLVW